MAQVPTIKQKKFCNKYLECGNASEAYRFAYNCQGMSAKTVRRKADEQFDNGVITAYIDTLRTKADKRAELKVDAVLAQLSDAILADVTDYVDPSGTIRVAEIKKMPIEQRRLIKSIKTTKDTVQIELIDKMAAIERMAKMRGWDAKEHHEVTITNELAKYTEAELRAIADGGK